MENSFSIVKRYTRKVPVDLLALCNELNIGVVYEYLEDDISGSIEKSETDDSDYTITVNARDAWTRQRFTIAHELGHFLFHRSKIGDGIFDNRFYRHSSDRMNTEIDQRDETQANAFAANLLMPSWYMRRNATNGMSPQELADLMIVSVAAVRVRLKTLIKEDRGRVRNLQETEEV